MSRQPGVWLAMLLVLLAGCATAEQKEVQRLQARAAYERGLAHLERKEAALALSAIQEAVGLDGRVAVYWNTLGWIYLQLARPDLALVPFTRAVELDATYGEAQMNVGVALAEMGQWEQALDAYRKAVVMPTLPRPDLAYHNMGVALLNLKRYREAEEALRFAISLDPKMAGAYYNLGLVLLAEDRKDDAKLAFRRVKELAPQSPFGQAAVQRLKDLGDGG